MQFSFALNSGYGEKQVTTWLNCSLFGKRAQTLSEMLKKGTKVGITGELTNRKYTTKEGDEKYSLEVRINDLTLLGSKDAQPAQNNAPKRDSVQSSGFDDIPDNDLDSESIPF